MNPQYLEHKRTGRLFQFNWGTVTIPPTDDELLAIFVSFIDSYLYYPNYAQLPFFEEPIEFMGCTVVEMSNTYKVYKACWNNA